MKHTVIVAVTLLLGMLLAVDTIAQNDSPLIKKGTVEISTIGTYLGTNILGLGAGIIKADDSWIGTLGMSIGYFPISLIGFEGSFGAIRSWDDESSQMNSVVIGKLVFSLVTEKGNSVIPYAFGGIGFLNSRYSTDYLGDMDSTDTLVNFGFGMKVPIKPLKRFAVRIEYSYMKDLDADYGNPLHGVSVGFSLFL